MGTVYQYYERSRRTEVINLTHACLHIVMTQKRYQGQVYSKLLKVPIRKCLMEISYRR